MTEAEVRAWYDRYLEVFASCCRGEGDLEPLLAFYAAPLLLTTDAGATLLPDEAAVADTVGGMVAGTHAAGYDRSDAVSIGVERLNATTALLRGVFIRRRADGSEIEPLAAAYVVVDGDAGPRIAALVVQSPVR